MSVITNRTRRIVLHEQAQVLTSILQQARGFMFQRPRSKALIFLFMPARFEAVHMFFVFGPLDILVLDGEGHVLALQEELRPWRIWNPKVKMSAMLELPAGTIRRTGTAIGDHVTISK